MNCRKFGVPMGGYVSPALAVITFSMVETKMEPGHDLIGGVVRYMDDVFGRYAVHTDSEEEQVNGYFANRRVFDFSSTFNTSGVG